MLKWMVHTSLNFELRLLKNIPFDNQLQIFCWPQFLSIFCRSARVDQFRYRVNWMQDLWHPSPTTSLPLMVWELFHQFNFHQTESHPRLQDWGKIDGSLKLFKKYIEFVETGETSCASGKKKTMVSGLRDYINSGFCGSRRHFNPNWVTVIF